MRRSVCTVAYKVFFEVCCKAKGLGLLTVFTSYSLRFVEGGFSNWKKALKKFAQQERSEMHQEALIKLAVKSSTVGQGAAQHTA